MWPLGHEFDILAVDVSKHLSLTNLVLAQRALIPNMAWLEGDGGYRSNQIVHFLIEIDLPLAKC